MSKAYFSPASFRFLRALDRNNSRDWFQAHKPDYERHVREPFLELIADMQAAHEEDFADFGIEFDNYGSTDSPENESVCHQIWQSIRAAG
ncbi:MAG: DUF2461 family protein, partial [Delftia sp.]|nr:DUF2461 family protein [Delftia sp.]